MELDLVGLDAVDDGLDGEVVGKGEAAVTFEAPGYVDDFRDGGRGGRGVDAGDGAVEALFFRGKVVEVEVFDASGPRKGIPLVWFVGRKGIVWGLVGAPEKEEDGKEDEGRTHPAGQLACHRGVGTGWWLCAIVKGEGE